jgi:hypothetical protein
MPSRRLRPPKPADDSLAPPSNERAEIETMARRLEELRRSASNSVLRGAYEVAVEALDAVVYRLGMLRAVEAPARPQVPGSVTSPARAPKTATSAKVAAARISAARKPRL